MTSAETETPRPPLRRDGDRRLLLGVCAGVARVLDADPVLVRVGAILIGLFTGPLALIAYVGAAVIMPRDDGRMLLAGDPPDRRETWLGWSGVALASILLLASAPAFDVFWVDHPFSSPLLVAALVAGVVVLARANRDRSRASAAMAGAAAAPSGGAAAGHAGTAGSPDPAAAPPADPSTAATVAATRDAPTAPLPAVRVAPTRAPGGGAPPTVEMRPPAPSEQPRGTSVFLVVAGIVVGAFAVVVALDALDVVELSATTVAILLAAGGLACGAAAAIFASRRGTGLTLALGIVLALSAGGVAAIAGELDDGVGERTIRPATAADLQPSYKLGLGLLDLDLRDTKLPPGVTTIKADVGAGEIQLRVPPEVRVEPVGDTGVDGRLAPLVPTKPASDTPIVRIDGHVDLGDSVQVIRDAP